MISKNELKYFSSLLKKKYRQKENKFLAEGEKNVEEGLNSNFKCEKIFVTDFFYENEKDYLNKINNHKEKLEVINSHEFNKISDTVTPQGIVAVFQIPSKKIPYDKIDTNLLVCLNNISDPGNVGTIIRNCDWFGINEIILTKGCAEIFNTKTIRASMGAIFHLSIFDEIDLGFLEIIKKKNYKILTADINGENIYNYNFPDKSIIVFSNESSGPSNELIKISDSIITIPKYGKAESLNVASASAVIMSEIRNLKPN
jgi:RNA methyltransferase, TrmH family